MLTQLRERARRHPAVTRFIGIIFFGWLFLYTLSAWIELFQGFELAQVLAEYVQGLTLGLIILILIGAPAWLVLTLILDKVFHSGDDSHHLDHGAGGGWDDQF